MGKGKEQGKHHGNGGKDHDEPPKHCDIKWPAVYPVRIEESTEDKTRHTDESRDRGRQIGIAKTLNRITAVGVAITAAGLWLYIVGCVTYRSSFSQQPHQTYFAYRLIGPPILEAKAPPRFLVLPGSMPILGFEIGVVVPKEKLVFMQETYARNDAN